MSDNGLIIGVFKGMGPVWSKISGNNNHNRRFVYVQREGAIPYQPFFVSDSETQMNQSFIWCKNVGISFFHFVTLYTFDGQTDGQTIHSCIDTAW